MNMTNVIHNVRNDVSATDYHFKDDSDDMSVVELSNNEYLNDKLIMSGWSICC